MIREEGYSVNSPLSLHWPAIAAGRVKELLLMATGYEHDNPDKMLLVPEVQAAGHIRGEQVSFAYEAGTPVLTDPPLISGPGTGWA